MASYQIPQNAGKFQVVVASGGHYAVWNGKHGRLEVSIPVKTKKQAREICAKINRKDHDGTIEVLN
jgi:hypothetical protein